MANIEVPVSHTETVPLVISSNGRLMLTKEATPERLAGWILEHNAKLHPIETSFFHKGALPGFGLVLLGCAVGVLVATLRRKK